MVRENSFLITMSQRPGQTCTGYFCDEHVHVEMHKPNSNYIIYEGGVDAGFRIFFGERKDELQIDYASPVNGTSVIYKPDRHELQIVSDQVGAECLFYRVNDGVVLLSNRLENLLVAGDAPNWTAIQCFLSFGYTLKSTTFFKNVKQTLPYQKVTFSLPDLNTKEEFYEPSQPGGASEGEPANAQSFSRRFSDILRGYKPMVLMMSAGWDSRTILAPKGSPVVAAYTHGDLSSRETTIAKKLTGHERKDHQFRDVSNLEINNRLLNEILEMNGHCLWPIWHVSSRNIAKSYDLPITSGVIGARVGGHNGFPSMGHRSQKVINSTHLISPKLVTEEKITRDLNNILKVPNTFWFTSETGQKLFSGTRTQSNEELHSTLNEYLRAGPDFSTAVEKFNYDHVSRQYMMKQPSMAKGFLGYYSPLSHPDLLNIAYNIPFKDRIHNKFTQKIVNNLNPELLEFPMAATLVKAKRPIIIQELSRVLRIVLESGSEALGWKKPSLGWFNYDHLYTGNVFPGIIESLTSSLWSKERMKEVVSQNPSKGIDAGSTLDMLCKIKTVDYYLNLSETDISYSGI